MSYLNWIKDEDVKRCTLEVLDAAKRADKNADKNFTSNVIDPFSALFDMMRQNISFEHWENQEKSRQVQKTLQNTVGFFHQNILGCTENSEDPGPNGGIDFINRDKKIIAEIKNKFNTMNSSSAAETYRKLKEFVARDEFMGFSAYVVFIIPKNSDDYDKAWSPNCKVMPLRDDIRQIDGESFYRKITGNKNALKDLFQVLPEVINDISDGNLDEVSRGRILTLFDEVYK